MREGFALWANPSSPHAEGRRARAALEDARARIKAALGWDGELIFTSGASEALAIGLGQSQLPIVGVSAVEHDSVLRAASGAPLLPVDANGLVLQDSCPLSGVVAVQQANSETGVIQPLHAVAQTVRKAGGVLLADCAQSAGKLALPDADLIALSAHKFGGPIGIGALLVRDWALLKPTGGQERGYRGGTENLPGALAMAAALEAGPSWIDEAALLRDLLDQAVVASGGEVVGAATTRVPTIGAYRMPGVSANAQLIRFDAAGIAVSAGSACSSGSLKTSHVLSAMKYPHPGEVIRVSFGWDTNEADVRAFLGQWRIIAGMVGE